MKSFFWKGIDTFGKNQKGYLSAKSERHLQNELLARGIALLFCKPERKGFRFSFTKKASMQQKAFFFEQLSVLIESGVDLIQSLKIVTNQLDSKILRDAVMNMIDDIVFGKSFADAMRQHPTLFSSFMINVVYSAEHSGRLAIALKKIADYLNACVLIKKKIKQASFAPALTLCFAFIIFLGIFLFVVPQFAYFFRSFEGELPAITQFVISASNFLRSSHVLFFIILFLFALLGIKKLCEVGRLKKLKDRVSLKLFFVGRIVLLYDLISFSHTLALFLKTGLDIKKALHNAVAVVQNVALKEKIFLVECEVTKGQTLTQAFQTVGRDYFPEHLIGLVSVGENTGKLDVMLEKAATFFQGELDKKLKFAVNAFQPIFMILTGLLIFFLILSVYLPIFNIATVI